VDLHREMEERRVLLDPVASWPDQVASMAVVAWRIRTGGLRLQEMFRPWCWSNVEDNSSATLAQGQGQQREAHGSHDGVWKLGVVLLIRSGCQGGRELRCIGRNPAPVLLVPTTT
jgi:hypothetical protein